jgi:hypothetical protein
VCATDANPPAPAVDLRVQCGADRLERPLEWAEIPVRADAEGDVDVDVRCAEVPGNRLRLTARQDLGNETA